MPSTIFSTILNELRDYNYVISKSDLQHQIDYVDTLSFEERETVNYYTSKNSYFINKALRTGDNGVSEFELKLQTILMNAPKLTSQIILYRGVNDVEHIKLGKNVFDGFYSTTHNPQRLKYLKCDKHIIRVIIPVGVRCLFVGNLNRNDGHIAEVLFPNKTIGWCKSLNEIVICGVDDKRKLHRNVIESESKFEYEPLGGVYDYDNVITSISPTILTHLNVKSLNLVCRYYPSVLLHMLKKRDFDFVELFDCDEKHHNFYNTRKFKYDTVLMNVCKTLDETIEYNHVIYTRTVLTFKLAKALMKIKIRNLEFHNTTFSDKIHPTELKKILKHFENVKIVN